MSFASCPIRCSARYSTSISLRRLPQALCRTNRISNASRCFHSSIPNLEKEQDLHERTVGQDVLKTEKASSYLKEFKDSYNAPPHNFPFGSRIPLYEIGKRKVTASGFLEKIVNVSKHITFARLRGPSPDHYVQLACINNSEVSNILRNIRVGSAISATGMIGKKLDPKSGKEDGFDINLITPKNTVDTSQVEIHLESIQCLNTIAPHISINTTDNTVQYPPQSRYLQIRFDQELAKRLQFRSQVAAQVRYVLRGFQEVETPILFKSTPEGAREFLVPTRKKGFAYALPQSPQQYKQILMASGISKYFQFAKCFRDEDLRADRQPEFTQIDLEMAWSTGERVMGQIEDLVKNVYKTFDGVDVFRGKKLPDTAFLRMPYQTAMSCYGSDKPDLRIEGKILNISKVVPAGLKGMLTSVKSPIVDAWRLRTNRDAKDVRNFVKKFMDSPDGIAFNANEDGAPGVCIYDPRAPLEGLQMFGHENAEKLSNTWTEWESEFEEGDVLLLQARKSAPLSGGSTALGRLRIAMHKAAVLEGLVEQDPSHHFLWVVDFPMFTPDNDIDPGQGGTSGFSATHHPFTAPKTAADVDLLMTKPLEAVADHYDLVVNGVELGGGSRRIHNAETQKFVMREILKMSEERMKDFSHLFDALAAGCPPHAGFAIGFDRMIAVMTGMESVKDVIAFPKSSKGEDMMVRSPARITDTEMARYHLRLRESRKGREGESPVPEAGEDLLADEKPSTS